MSFLRAFLPIAESPVEHHIQRIYSLTMIICLAVFFIVEIALVVAIVRFRRRPGARPATFTHNNLLEVAWTIVPALLLVVIAVPTYKTLKFIDTMPRHPFLTVEVIGHQWYWEYRIPPQPATHGKAVSLLDVTNSKALVVPVDRTVELVVTGADVIHDFFVPALGLKIDANPGRINHAWFLADKAGMYDGQCSRLCGIFHSKMYIHVEATSVAAFDRWVAAHAAAG